jgi:hypothetical protein
LLRNWLRSRTEPESLLGAIHPARAGAAVQRSAVIERFSAPTASTKIVCSHPFLARAPALDPSSAAYARSARGHPHNIAATMPPGAGGMDCWQAAVPTRQFGIAGLARAHVGVVLGGRCTPDRSFVLVSALMRVKVVRGRRVPVCDGTDVLDVTVGHPDDARADRHEPPVACCRHMSTSGPRVRSQHPGSNAPERTQIVQVVKTSASTKAPR